MNDLPLLNAQQVRRLVPMAAAVDALETALRGGLDPEADPARGIVEAAAGQLLLMPAVGDGYAGVKLATVTPGNPDRGLPRIQGLYVLLDAATLAPVALLDGSALTALRTPAVSAVAVRHLAVAEARRLMVFGTGPQAWGHVKALRVVRPLEHVAVVARDRAGIDAFVARCRDAGLAADAAEPSSVADADIVACATTARAPLFDGRLLPGHAAVVAVGSHEPDAREVDDETVRRSTVIVEARAAAQREAGDLVLPLRSGLVGADHIAGNLADLVCGRVDVDPARPRLFKSVGMAWEDLVVAGVAYEGSREKP